MKKKLRAVEKMFIKTEIPMNLAIKKIAKIQETMPLVSVKNIRFKPLTLFKARGGLAQTRGTL